MEQPKISVIIPVYNTEKYLRQCLDSVVNQTLKEIEIICVNDCSPDNSLEILKEYKEKDSRIKIIDLKENGGLGHTRNVAIKEAHGDYIMYLDSDDWFELNACEEAYNQISINQNDFVFFNYYTYYENNGKRSWNQKKFHVLQEEKNVNHINLNQLVKPFNCGAECWFKIYKRDFIIKNKLIFLEKCNFEDRPFYFQAFIKSHSISALNKPLLNYRKRVASITDNSKYWKDTIKSWEIAKDYLNNKTSEIAKKSFMINHINSLLWWFGIYIKKDKSIKIEFYNKVRNALLSYSISEVAEISDYIDFNEFKNITKSKTYKDFIFYQKISNLFLIKKDEKRYIIKFFNLKFSIKRSKTNIIEKIFSIKNANRHKILTTLGVKIKLSSIAKKIKNNRIVFMNFEGNGFGCNPKYIAKEIIRQKLPYEMIWLTNNNITLDQFPPEVKVEKYSTYNALKYFASSKVWIKNSRIRKLPNKGLIKKNNQLYIQTWHGSVAFKKIEKDIIHCEHMAKYLKDAQIDSTYMDYLLTPSRFDTEKFSTNFYFNGPILETGYPRNDIFFYSDEEKQKIINNVKKRYNITSDKKIAIYVPTFRDNKDINVYKLPSEKLCTTLKNKFGSKWVFMVRLHPNIAYKEEELSKLFPNAINVTSYPDIQELLLASDIFISDYTSSIWDFVLQNKPAFIYAPDIEAYTHERDFYIPLNQMPFSLSQNEDELIENIRNFNKNIYEKNLDEFQKFRGIVDDGKASSRVVEVIKKYIETGQ